MQQTLRRRLTLSPDDAFFILLRAREFDDGIDLAGFAPEEGAPDAAPPVEDNDAVEADLAAVIGRLDDEALRDLIALIWIGRGDYAADEWRQARRAAGDLARDRVPGYVAGLPLVSDCLERGLSAFGHTLADYVATH
jgi:uncharacterized protein DUF3775